MFMFLKPFQDGHDHVAPTFIKGLASALSLDLHSTTMLKQKMSSVEECSLQKTTMLSKHKKCRIQATIYICC